MLLLLCGSELVSYFLWHRKAKRAAEEGRFQETRGNRPAQIAALWIIGVGLVCWFLSLKGQMLVFGLFGMGYVVLLYLSVDRVKCLLKRKQFSTGSARLLTIAASVVIAIALMVITTALSIQGTNRGWFGGKETAGINWDISEDGLPLTSAQLTGESDEEYFTHWSGTASPLLARLEAYQLPRGNGLSDIYYEVWKTSLPWIYDLCLKETLRELEEEANEIALEISNSYVSQTLSPETSFGLAAVDPEEWGAQAVYRRQSERGTFQVTYLVCWADKVAVVRFGWTPTPEQIKGAAEQLQSL